MSSIPTRVTYRGLKQMNTLESEVHDRVQWLEQFYGRIMACRVLIEVPHRHRRDGRHVRVRLELTVPGGAPIVVSHEPSLHGSLKDMEETEPHKQAEVDEVHRYARVAVHEVFDVARRQLQDFAREQRGAIKTHEAAEP
ncbi:MAG TPA: hypothetical protein VIK60_15825 [Vicinamibacterales bacterium]